MLRSPAPSSSPQETTSSASPSKKSVLSMAGVANIFIHLRRLDDGAAKRTNRVVLVSGEPKTHPGIADSSKNSGQIPVEYTEQYICVGGVNVSTLLRASRSALLENCEYIGANALVDELWECRITGPKPVHNGTYKVFIRYTASATRSTVPDPHKPVNLDKAKDVPGLMTILSRGPL